MPTLPEPRWIHFISSGLLYHWKEQYARGRFNNKPSKESALEDLVRQLEQLVGKLTLENEFLQKALRGVLLPFRQGLSKSLFKLFEMKIYCIKFIRKHFSLSDNINNQFI